MMSKKQIQNLNEILNLDLNVCILMNNIMRSQWIEPTTTCKKPMNFSHQVNYQMQEKVFKEQHKKYFGHANHWIITMLYYGDVATCLTHNFGEK